LYKFSLDKWTEISEAQKLPTIEKDIVFEFSNRAQLRDDLQLFFFKNFEFYTLKFTTKNPSKDKIDLNLGNLSWATYFKSIYLEAGDYKFLFFDKETIGTQGRKIFEMILGLPLTYPINMLNVQHDLISTEISKQKFKQEGISIIPSANKKDIESELGDVQNQILSVHSIGLKVGLDEKPFLDEYAKIQTRLNENRVKSLQLDQERQKQILNINSVNEEIGNLNLDKDKISQEIGRISKQLLNMKLYSDTERFFSNLEVKICPHCETQVTQDKKEREKETHACSLCGEISRDQKVDLDEINQKVDSLKGEEQSLNSRFREVENILSIKVTELKKSQEFLNKLQEGFEDSVQIQIDSTRLTQLQQELERINGERIKQAALIEQYEKLRAREAVLQYQLGQSDESKLVPIHDVIGPLILKREIIAYALDQLERKRSQINKDIMEKLETLIFKEIVEFGVANVEKVQINEKYDLIITQNSVAMNFVDLNEGEHLRVKLAFYLSLTQLDIEHSLGRHPRFLIFDSPGGEEMIQRHLSGLAEVLKLVNKRFANNLQIFIGSAMRDFNGITDKKRSAVYEADEFVF
jgi:hypothetical protein